jgi:hypothetical protein
MAASTTLAHLDRRGSATCGKARPFDAEGIARSWGDRFLFGDRESVSGDAQRGVMVKTAAPSPLVVAKSEFLLEMLIIALDAPAQLDGVHQDGTAAVGG